MFYRRLRIAVASAAVLFMALLAHAQFAAENERQTERMYSVDGAWYGTVTIPGVDVTPTLDTFTLDSRLSGQQGTFLCTIPSVIKMPNPSNPNGWLGITPSGHGTWVRIGKNKYAFTAFRTIYDENGHPFGLARNWGVITPISDDEYTGTLNVQYSLADGTPFTPVFTGDMHSHRIAIKFE